MDQQIQVPLYVRLLRLRNIYPRSWQRAVLGEGSFGVAILLVMMDLASAWLLIALPVAVAVVVKFHDLLVGALKPSNDSAPARMDRTGAGRAGGGAG